jgi:hypothetical protein
MQCAHCGFGITEHQKFCGACGSSTTGQTTATLAVGQASRPPAQVLFSSVVTTPSAVTPKKIILGAVCLYACIFGEVVLPQILQPAATWVARIALPTLAVFWFIRIISKRVKIGLLIMSVVLVIGIEGFEETRNHDNERQAAAKAYAGSLLKASQDEEAFKKMTLPQHLSRARDELTTVANPEQIIDGRKHIEALHGTPLENQGIALLNHYQSDKSKADKAAALLKERADKAAVALEIQNEKKEKAYAEIVNTSIRIAMAKTVENAMLADGYNVDVNAVGPNHTILRIRWIGVSKVMAYQMSQHPEIFETARTNGFKKLVITDGYDEAWTWTL